MSDAKFEAHYAKMRKEAVREAQEMANDPKTSSQQSARLRENIKNYSPGGRFYTL